jgi:hypothetical protein
MDYPPNAAPLTGAVVFELSIDINTARAPVFIGGWWEPAQGRCVGP